MKTGQKLERKKSMQITNILCYQCLWQHLFALFNILCYQRLWQHLFVLFNIFFYQCLWQLYCNKTYFLSLIHI